jgi:YD repeat-containing protein
MKRTLFAAAVVAALIVVPTVANADPGTTITAPATLTIGDTLSVTVSGPVVITAGGWYNTLTSTTGACAVRKYGSYSNGGQKTEYACTGADTLGGKTDNAGLQQFIGADGQYVGVTINALPVVTPPPPTPVVKLVTAESTCAGTYTNTISNIGGANLVGGSLANSYCTPPNLAAVTLPAGATITYRTVCNRFHSCYRGNGYVVRGLNIPAGGSVVVSFVVGA